MNEILLQENNKVSAEAESHENIESDIYENDLCQIDDMSFYYKKENTEWRKRAFDIKLESTYDTENQNGMTFIHENE